MKRRGYHKLALPKQSTCTLVASATIGHLFCKALMTDWAYGCLEFAVCLVWHLFQAGGTGGISG